MDVLGNGTIVTYNGAWPYEPGLSVFAIADQTVQDVLGKLVTSGLVSRSAPVIDSSLTGFVEGTNYQVTLQLEVQNGLGFGTTDDIISIIRHWVYQVTGSFPSGDSIPKVQTPTPTVDTSSLPPGTTVATGQPGATAPPAKGCLAGSSNDTTGSFSLSCWWGNLTTKGLSTVGLLAIAIVAGIGIFLYAQAPRRTSVSVV